MRAGVVLDGRLEDLPAMLTVEEAARVLRIGPPDRGRAL